MIHPLIFKSIYKEKIWGERNIERYFDKNIPENLMIGESWEIAQNSLDISHLKEKINYARISEKNLSELIDKYREKLVGKKIYERYQNKFPLLIKFLDINDRLSVQVHPDNRYALKNEGEFGKAEAWYIIDTSGDAEMILGKSNEVSKDEFIKRVKNKDFRGLFNKVKVKKGDLLYIKPGTVHATIRGSILICEVQQNSNCTYRLYDFDRDFNGKKRELHIDKALDVIDYKSDFFKENLIVNKKEAEMDKNLNRTQNLLETEYFKIEKINILKKWKDKIDEEFKIYSVISGRGKIIYYGKNYALSIAKGDNILIPANLDLQIKGEMEILKTMC